MSYEQKKCKNCGGELILKGKSWQCPFCGSMYYDETVNSNLLDRAYSFLRANDFENAERECDDVIAKDKKNYEALWVRAQARNRITFVDDIGGKKVPTCNNIGGRKFSDDGDVKNAIICAPDEIKENYRALAKKIDDISAEWLAKASKEPECDIFICYKKTDENGNDTPDSNYLLNLYARLSQSYRVFFSQVSLNDKMGEQYEPYIYNALKTAKVMIVYAEKAEYFNAPWVKNEWSRYIERIKSGEKANDSLIVAHKGVDPYAIPKALLGGRQALDMSGATASIDLFNKIDALIEAASKAGKLGTIKIEGGQISKKASHIQQSTIEKRTIGGGAGKQTIDEEALLDNVKYFIKNNRLSDAKRNVQNILSINPKSAEGIKYEIILNNNCKYETDLTSLTHLNGIERLNDFFACANKEQAESMLDILYDMRNMTEGEYLKILNIILPFDYSKRDKNIEKLFTWSAQKDYSRIFDLLILTLDSSEVEKYISLNLLYAENRIKEQKYKTAEAYINKVLAVDEGNEYALNDLVKLAISLGYEKDAIIEKFETALKYSKDINSTIVEVLNHISVQQNVTTHYLLAKQVMQYYKGEPDRKFINSVVAVGEAFLKHSAFEQAKSLYTIAISYDGHNYSARRGLCLCALGVYGEDGVYASDTPINTLAEFDVWLGMAPNDKKDYILSIASKQEEHIAQRNEERKKLRAEQARKKAEQDRIAAEKRAIQAKKDAEIRAQKEADSRKKVGSFFITLGGYAILFVSGLISWAIFHGQTEEWDDGVFALLIPTIATVGVAFYFPKFAKERGHVFIAVLGAFALLGHDIYVFALTKDFYAEASWPGFFIMILIEIGIYIGIFND